MADLKSRGGGVLAWTALVVATGVALAGMATWGFDLVEPARDSEVDLSAESDALGMTGGKGAAGAESALKGGDKHRRIGENLLHGETVVARKQGRPVTIVVQRGEVIKIGDRGMTIESADGFTQRWKLPVNAPVRIFEDGDRIEKDVLDVLEVGDQIAVAGPKFRNDSQVARLILLD